LKHTLRLIFFFTILLTGLFGYERSFGQTVTFNPQTTNLATGTLTGYSSTNVAVYGFSLTVTGAPETIGTVNIKDNINGGANNLANIFNNGRLYSTPTSGYNAANPGTQVGTVNFGTGLITISGINDAIAVGQTMYYYLVVDCIATTNTAFQPFIGYGQSPVGIISTGGTNYNNNNNGFENYYTIAAGTPPDIVLNNLTTGLASTSTTLIPSQAGVAVFGFSVTTNGVSRTFNKFNINSTSSTLTSHIASAILYRSTNNSYTAGAETQISTASTIGTQYINFTTNDETVNNTTRYYFVVVTLKSSFPAADDIQFNFTDGQSTPALQQTTPNRDYNDFNVLGSTYNFNASRLTITSQQTGVSAATITANQTDVALFGFGIQSTNAITISEININSNNANAGDYFGNGKLYYSTNNSYTAGAETLAGTVVFNDSYATVTLTAQNTFAANQTRYYFLVADNIGGAPSATIAFNFTSGQGADAIVQSAPFTSPYNTFAVQGNTFNLPSPTIFVSGANSAANGITQGVLAFGQTNIVLFGFGVEAFGTTQTFTQINIKTSGLENQYFSNGRLYRSTTNVFPGGSPLYSGASVSIGGGGYVVCTVNETITPGTTYYYWLVADYTVNSGPPNAAYTFSFESGQGQQAFTPTPYSTAYNTYNVTGQAFNIATTLDWVGGTSNSFTDATNFKTLNNSNGTVPISTTIVRIGGRTYTNAPAIAANTTIGGLTFGSVVPAPALTVNSGITLTLNNAFNILTGSSPTITGPGSVTVVYGSF
jgi:trimeric autotransporter adhesin